MPPESPQPYRAFISYSHQDAAWATWLHRGLERYRVPRRLVGRETPVGPVPRALYPIFRDRDELPSAGELGLVIDEALRRSAFLIVICSPQAARSRWVNEEIRSYKALGREDRILALIVDGEPGAADPARECFPPLLTRRVDGSGRDTGERCEPLAADARSAGDGREVARRKLIAGLLGVGYGELESRERQRARWQRLQAFAAGLALIAAATGLWQEAQRRNAAIQREARLDRLYDLGREEVLNGNGARAASYLAEVRAAGRDTVALRYLLGRAMPAIDAASGPVLHPASNPQVGLVAYSHDGRRVFLAAQDTISVWNSESGTLLATSAPFLSSDRESLSVAPDDRHVVHETNATAFQADVRLTLYDAASAAVVATLAAETSTGQARGNAFRAWSPDGRRLLVIDAARHAQVIDADSGRPLLTLPGSARTSASWSEDGRQIVAADRDGRICVHDGASGAPIRCFDARRRIPTRAFFAEHDRRIYTLDGDGALRVYEAASGALDDALGGHAGNIETALLSADGRRLLTAARDDARLWDLASGRQLLAIRYAPSLRAGIDLRPDGRQIAAMLDQTRAGIWDADGGSMSAVLEGHSTVVEALRYSPDGQELLSGASDGSARIWKLAALEARPLAWLRHDPPLDPRDSSGSVDVAFSSDGTRLASSGADGRVRIWDGRDGHPLATLEGHRRTTRQVGWRPDGKQLASAAADGTLRLWNPVDGSPVATLSGHTAQRVHTALWSPDGSRLLSIAGNYDEAEADTTPRLYDDAGRLVAQLTGHTRWIFTGAAFSADSRRIVTASEDRTARIWDSHDGRLLQTLEGHGDEVLEASFSRDGRRVVTASYDGTARIWDADSGRELQRLSRPDLGGFGYARYADDGERVALSSLNGPGLLWWPATGRTQPLVGHTSVSYWLQFSPDGALLASASTDGSARLWDAVSGALLQVFTIPTRYGYQQKAAFSPDGLRLATAGQSTPASAELWSLRPEDRDADTLSALVRCRSPWRVEGERLVPTEAPAATCADR